jgi:protein-L-isoaspartate(D-aspartate) O-methyltransferase
VGSQGRVLSVEIVSELVELAKDNVRQERVGNVEIVHGDGSLGYVDQAPYDAIVVSCGAPEVPESLLEQLDVGGRLVIPVGKRVHQQLIRVMRTQDGFERENFGGCAFVPLVGEEGFDESRV